MRSNLKSLRGSGKWGQIVDDGNVGWRQTISSAIQVPTQQSLSFKWISIKSDSIKLMGSCVPRPTFHRTGRNSAAWSALLTDPQSPQAKQIPSDFIRERLRWSSLTTAAGGGIGGTWLGGDKWDDEWAVECDYLRRWCWFPGSRFRMSRRPTLRSGRRPMWPPRPSASPAAPRSMPPSEPTITAIKSPS